MGKTSTVGQRIAGAVVGLLVGAVALALVGVLIAAQFAPDSNGDPDGRAGREALFIFVILVGPGLLIGGTVGAAAGATAAQRILRQSGSFWRALLGTVVGTLISIPFGFMGFGVLLSPVLVVGGAVIGSGWKSKTADAVVARPQQGVISPSDMLKRQPGQAKCPFCHSMTFRVVKEVGLRKCSDCHSILPNYILGNAQSTGQM
jgi:hypothetical protein